MNILLTGGTGFIGSYVLMALIQEGHSVTVLARNKSKVPSFCSLPRVEILEVPMNDYDGISRAVVNKDACIHVALNYNDSSAYDMLMNDTASSIFLASECARAGVSHFIYTSSTAALDNIYSLKNPQQIDETPYQANTQSKQDPQSYYGATKAATENFLMAIGSQTSMRITVIRPGYTFGNPVAPDSFTQPDRRFHSIVESAKKGNDIEIIVNDGTQFLWAGDLAKIYISALNSKQTKQVYFGLSNEWTSWEYIAQESIRICNSKSNIIRNDLGWSNVPILFDVSDIEKDFGFRFSPIPHIQDHILYLAQL